MPKQARNAVSRSDEDCCDSRCCGSGCSCRTASALDCCRVDGIVNVDGRGQMVLPKELRERAGIRPNQKLALVSWVKDDRVCCITLQPAEELAELVRRTYGPLLSNGPTAR